MTQAAVHAVDGLLQALPYAGPLAHPHLAVQLAAAQRIVRADHYLQLVRTVHFLVRTVDGALSLQTEMNIFLETFSAARNDFNFDSTHHFPLSVF